MGTAGVLGRVFRFLIIAVLLAASPCFAEDKVAPVFEQLDDLMIRVESGVSLNTYAEALADIKIQYKKALSHPDTVDNPLLSDRMKKVISYMDDYAKAWRWQDTDGYKVIGKPPVYVSGDSCRVKLSNGGTVYEISCVKTKILDVLKENLVSARSAHYNGW